MRGAVMRGAVMRESFATALRCIECGAEYPLEYRLECTACRGLLELAYDWGR